MSSNVGIKVIARFRPFNENERKKQDQSIRSEFDLQISQGTHIDIKVDKNQYNFNFDAVYDASASQKEVYNFAAKPCIDDVLEGYNGTIFAYGQTGSGKTWSMFGNREHDDTKGIIPRASGQIFDHIDKDVRNIEYSIRCSFLEIYKERIYDLLVPTPPSNKERPTLKIRETPQKGVWVEGLSEEFVACEEDIDELVQLGEGTRVVSSTDMNKVSSRSHSVFIILIQQKAEDGSIKTGKLNLVDLAGSERVGKTNASGKQLEEAKEINKSLSSLGKCIYTLSELAKAPAGSKSPLHIPYRESSLTRILQESLGGNCKTTLLVACSPAIYNADETVSTLRFGASAKTIKNTVTVNKKRSIEELESLVKTLNKELVQLKRYSQKLERQLEFVQPTDFADPAKAEQFKKLMSASAVEKEKQNKEKEDPTSPSPHRPTKSVSGPVSLSLPGTPTAADGSSVSPRIQKLKGTAGSEAPQTRQRSPSFSGAESEDDGEPSFGWDPLAMAELKTQLEQLKGTTSGQIEQYKIELSEAKQREEEFKSHRIEAEKSLKKMETRYNKLKTKHAEDTINLNLKIQALEDGEGNNNDEAIILLFADNERLEAEVLALQAQIAGKPIPAASKKEKEVKVTDAILSKLPDDAKSMVEDLQRKLKQANDREQAVMNKVKAAKDKRKKALIKLTEQHTLLKTELEELVADKKLLEVEYETEKEQHKESEAQLRETIEVLERQLKAKSRVFVPVKRKLMLNPLQEKVDIQNHIGTLRKTNSPFLEASRQQHERSMAIITRGEKIFGGKVANLIEEADRRAYYKRIFDHGDRNKNGTLSASEIRGILRAMGASVSETDFVQLMKQLDPQETDDVDFETFFAGMTSKA